MRLVKLGGSVITAKGGAKRVRRDALRRLALEAASASEGGLAVLHGAGSFGHTLARQANLRAGIASPAQARAASLVAADVRTLHVEVLRALHAAGLRPWSVPPGQVAMARGGELAALAMGPFRLALQLGFAPVSCGDVVLDELQGVAIVSADEIAQRLAGELAAERMVFATDVDGIFTAPPGTPGAELVGRCTADELRGMRLGGSAKTDVTGGMAGKGAAIAAMAEMGCEVWVVNGLKAGRLRDALRGDARVGTRVSP